MTNRKPALLFSMCAAFSALTSFAAIPVRWSTDAYKVKPLTYECYHGETLDIAASITAYGYPLDLHGKTARLYWQTNGMASAWWSTNAEVRVEGGATNVLAAVWSGSFDTGSKSVTGFIGVEGENYRAAFQLNFLESPGFSPNALPFPPQAINWANVANVNADSAPFVVKGGSGGLTPENVTNIVDTIVASSNLASVAYVDTSNETTLASANAYTTAVSNDFHVAVTNLDAVKRDKTDNVCAATTYSSWTFSGDVQSDETYEVTEEEGEFVYEGKFFYRLYINGVERWGDGYFDEKQTHLNANIDFEGTRYVVCDRHKTSSSGHPFTTWDNVQTASTNAATSVVSNYLDYALMNLTAATLSLRSGEIGNYETTADFTLALSFADNGRSGDCLLYVANTDAANDHTIDITPNTYKFVSADIEKARTLGKATTNLVMFTRLKSDTVLVSKQEVK